MPTFGVVHYHATDIRDSPDIPLAVLRLLEVSEENGSKVSFQGMLSGTDKFSRLTRLSPKSLKQLEVDIRGGVYTNLLAFRGSKNQPKAAVSLDLDASAEKALLPYAVAFNGFFQTQEQLDKCERISLDLWRLFHPGYGFSVLGNSENEVLAELHHTPILPWNSPDRAEIEARFVGLQRLRPKLGDIVRGGAWGTFLGTNLVQKLGGQARVLANAPVFKALPLDQGAVYLRLTKDPVLLNSSAYVQAVRQLENYLRPVLPPREFIQV
jgi:hypothetical protein